MLEWLKKCVINLHSVTAYVLAEDQDIMNTVPVLYAVCSPNQIVDSVHRRLSPWDHLVKSRQLGSSGHQFANFVSKNLPRECSLPTANLSDQALDNAHGAWFWLSDIKCKKSETSLWHSILQVFLQFHSLTIANLPPVLSKQAMISRLPCRHQSPGWRLCHNRTQRH